MDQVYQHAQVTIAVDRASAARYGCFAERNLHFLMLHEKHRSQSEPSTSSIGSMNSRGTPDTVTDRHRSNVHDQAQTIATANGLRSMHEHPSLGRAQDPFAGPIMASPLQQRAWVLQEFMLPSRILHYGPRQILWECKELTASETAPEGVHGYSGGNVGGDVVYTPLGLRQFTLEKASKPSHWRDEIVIPYSKRLLTKPKDRLIAVSALARKWQDFTGDRYLAGLWQTSLIPDLCWQRYQDNDVESDSADELSSDSCIIGDSTRPYRSRLDGLSVTDFDAAIERLQCKDFPDFELYRYLYGASQDDTETLLVPTWSWCSINDEVHYFTKTVDYLASVIEAQVGPEGCNIFGPSVTGKIRLHGFLFPVKVVLTSKALQNFEAFIDIDGPIVNIRASGQIENKRLKVKSLENIYFLPLTTDKSGFGLGCVGLLLAPSGVKEWFMRISLLDFPIKKGFTWPSESLKQDVIII